MELIILYCICKLWKGQSWNQTKEKANNLKNQPVSHPVFCPFCSAKCSTSKNAMHARGKTENKEPIITTAPRRSLDALRDVDS